jgi:hypothetical protein
VRDAGGQDVIEGGNAVGRDEQQLFAIHPVHVSDFTAGVKLEIREISSQKDGIEKFSSHWEILQVRSDGYFSRSGNFVNRRDQPSRRSRYPVEEKQVEAGVRINRNAIPAASLWKN